MDRYMTIDEVAKVTRASTAAVRLWIRRGDLKPTVRLAKRRLVAERVLEKFLAEVAKKSQPRRQGFAMNKPSTRKRTKRSAKR